MLFNEPADLRPMLRHELSCLGRAAAVDPAVDDVLVWQGSNDIEWKDPSLLAPLLLNYLYKPGIAGGQIAHGGTVAGDDLTFRDNTVDLNEVTLTQGLVGGLIEAKLSDTDLAIRHIGAGSQVAFNNNPTNLHVILGAELFTGTNNLNVGVGMFPTLQTGGVTQSLYGIQGNIFFGGNTWGAGSLASALQFIPAPDYQYGSAAWGNTNLDVIGITTGGFVNLLTTSPINTKSLKGISLQTMTALFGGMGAVSTPEAVGVDIRTPFVGTGVIDEQTGLKIWPQYYATANYGAWLMGDNDGCDVCFGSGKRGTGAGTITKAGANMTLFILGAGFAAGDIGKTIIIRGATTPSNNGPKVITGVFAPNICNWTDVYGGATEPFPAGGTWYIPTNPDARIYYDGDDLIIDPDFQTAGDRVLIGATGDDDMLLNDIEIDGDLDHDGTGVGFYGTAPIAQPGAAGAGGWAAGGGANNVNDLDTFTGGVGATGYTIGDLVAIMKNFGLIAP